MEGMKTVPFNAMMLPGQSAFPDTIKIDLAKTEPVAAIPMGNKQPKSARHVDTPTRESESPKYKDAKLSDFPRIVGFA